MTEGGYWDQVLKTKPDHFKKYLNERMAIKRFGKVMKYQISLLFYPQKRIILCRSLIFF